MASPVVRCSAQQVSDSCGIHGDSMVTNGIQWDLMGFNGIGWDLMGFNGI